MGMAHEYRAVRSTGCRASRLQARIWTTTLFESGQKPQRVLVSNVAGPVMAKTLARLTKKVFRLNIEFVTAAQEYHGLTNGYLDPSLLGADRWLALIGAWTKARSALCVVDAGTAVRWTAWTQGSASRRIDRPRHSHDARGLDE